MEKTATKCIRCSGTIRLPSAKKGYLNCPICKKRIWASTDHDGLIHEVYNNYLHNYGAAIGSIFMIIITLGWFPILLSSAKGSEHLIYYITSSALISVLVGHKLQQHQPHGRIFINIIKSSLKFYWPLLVISSAFAVIQFWLSFTTDISASKTIFEYESFIAKNRQLYIDFFDPNKSVYLIAALTLAIFFLIPVCAARSFSLNLLSKTSKTITYTYVLLTLIVSFTFCGDILNGNIVNRVVRLNEEIKDVRRAYVNLCIDVEADLKSSLVQQINKEVISDTFHEDLEYIYTEIIKSLRLIFKFASFDLFFYEYRINNDFTLNPNDVNKIKTADIDDVVWSVDKAQVSEFDAIKKYREYLGTRYKTNTTIDSISAKPPSNQHVYQERIPINASKHKISEIKKTLKKWQGQMKHDLEIVTNNVLKLASDVTAKNLFIDYISSIKLDLYSEQISVIFDFFITEPFTEMITSVVSKLTAKAIESTNPKDKLQQLWLGSIKQIISHKEGTLLKKTSHDIAIGVTKQRERLANLYEQTSESITQAIKNGYETQIDNLKARWNRYLTLNGRPMDSKEATKVLDKVCDRIMKIDNPYERLSLSNAIAHQIIADSSLFNYEKSQIILNIEKSELSTDSYASFLSRKAKNAAMVEKNGKWGTIRDNIRNKNFKSLPVGFDEEFLTIINQMIVDWDQEVETQALQAYFNTNNALVFEWEKRFNSFLIEHPEYSFCWGNIVKDIIPESDISKYLKIRKREYIKLANDLIESEKNREISEFGTSNIANSNMDDINIPLIPIPEDGLRYYFNNVNHLPAIRIQRFLNSDFRKLSETKFKCKDPATLEVWVYYIPPVKPERKIAEIPICLGF